mgnify:CR=1 FL=1
MHRPQPKTPRAPLRPALRLLFLIAALVTVLVACNTTPSQRTNTRPDPTPTEAPAYNPNVPRQGPGKSLPLHLGFIPKGTGEAPTLRAQAQGDVIVQMQALVISARADAEDEPSVGAWLALLEQAGMPYERIVATDPQWNAQTLADFLVTPDGVGRFQAVLLSTNNLVYDAGPGVPPANRYPSAFTDDQWKVLFDYERAYGVRQAALYGAAWSGATPSEDDYGIIDPSGGQGLNNVVISPTAAGLGIFTDVDASSSITLRDTWGYPSTGNQDFSTPLLVDGSGHILAAQINTNGRERITLFFDNAAWGGIPVVYTQQLGAALLRWATRGVHIGERRNSFQADVDDWFLEAGHWDVTTHSIDDREGHGIRLTAKDVLSLRDQQAGLQAIAGGIASDFRWSMAFNGMGTTEPGEGSVPANCVESTSATLTYITKCLANDFWWVSHTWDHEYMDYILPAVGGARNLNVAGVTDRLTWNDDLAAAYGFGATYSRNSVVTGDISGLGWYDPLGPDHDPVQKVDHGLDWASPYFIQGTYNTGHTYVASNMSTPSHEPDCWACGTYLTLDNNHYLPLSGFEVFLVPRWPTNVFATVTRPAEVVDAYNMVYGLHGSDPNHFDHDLTYPEILDVDTSIALSHLLSGSPYPHYFHTPNAVEYETGKSLLTDWATVLFTKYASLVNEPLLSHKNDDSAAYVQARTDFDAAGVTGTWNRTTGKITIRSANGGPAFLTGASLGAGAHDSVYNGRTISERELGAGQSVVIDVTTAAPGAPTIQSFSATPATILDGGTAQLTWTVFGPHSDITARVKGGAAVGSNLNASASLPVSPTTTTTYELVVTPLQGSAVTREATVEVTPVQPAVTSFTADPNPVAYGGTTQLAWTVTGSATDVAIRPQGGANLASGLARSGTLTTPALTSGTTYELVATWAGGAPVVSALTVDVTAPDAPIVTSFAADPAAIPANGTSQLTWAVDGGPTTDVSIRIQGQDGTAVGSLDRAGTWTTPILNATTTYELVATGPGGTATRSATVTVVGAPSATFTATATEIAAGGSSTLEWIVTGTTSSVLIREKAGPTLYQNLQPAGSQSVSPAATTTYELVMGWLGGEVVQEAIVTVRTAPAVSLTTATPAIVFGGSTTLEWSVSGVSTGVTLYRDGELVDTLSGTGGQYVVQPSATGTYELRAAWLAGTVTATQRVVVTPTVALSATPTSVVEGSSSTLAWEIGGGFTGATLREQGSSGAPVAATGSQSVSPITETTYELVVAYAGATGPAETSATATVAVTPAPVAPIIESFTATPTALLNGQSTQLQWNVTGTTTGISLTANGATIGTDLGSSGPRTESPTTTTTYVLSAAWEGGDPITATVAVTVTQPQTPTGTLTATPATIIVGSSSTLNWSVAGDFTNVTVRAQGGATLSSGPSATGETIVTPTVTTTYELVATQISGATLTVSTATVTVNEPTAPTATLTATPATITAGGSTTLSWNVEGTYASIRLGIVGGADIGGDRDPSGTLVVSPNATTTYELRVAWANGTVTTPRQVVVTPTATLTATPETITSGESSTLAWTVVGGFTSATLRAQGTAGTAVNATGNQVVSPTATTVFELVVAYVGGSDVVASQTLTVNPPPVAPTIASFTAGANPITVGQTTQLAWEIGAGPTTSVAIRIQGQAEPVADALARTGTWTTPALAATTTYELVATGPGGTATAPLTVTVNPLPVAPVIAGFTADPTAIIASQSSQLTWSVTGTYTAIGLRVGGTVIRDDLGASGVLTVTPATTTTYELFVTWSGGPAVVSQATITVTTPTAPTGTLTADPTTITVGSSSTLSWNVAGDFTTVTVRAANGDVERTNAGASGTAVVTPGATTTYELVAQPLIGSPSVVATTTVTVNPLPVAPSAELSADSTNITAGGSTILRWAVGGDFTTVRLRANGSDIGGDRAATGELIVSPATTTTYQLVVAWDGGPDVVREVTVTVNPPEAPLAQLTATEPTITFGGSTNLTWSVTGTHAGISLSTSTGTVLEADLGASGSLAVTPGATTTYVLEVAWAGGTVTRTAQVVVTPTVSFSATPTSIVSGESSTLSWSVGGGFTGATLRQQGTGGAPVGATGSEVVAPTATTTYELVVSYAGGTDIVATRTITVAAAPVAPQITDFTATPAAITAGGSSLLGWNVTGSATNISLRVGGTAVESGLAASGTLPVAPTVTTTYELYVTWSGGAAVTRTVQVTVTTPTAPSGTLIATPATILVGGTSTLAWSVTGDFTNATVRTASGQVISSGAAASGSTVVSPTTTTTYQLLATPIGGSSTVIATATVTVEPVPVAPTASLGANPTTITAGGSSTLSWAVSGTYTTIRLRAAGGANIGGNRPSTGQAVVSPTTTTTYELVVTWSGGEVIRSASVTVNPAAPQVSFSATPQAIVAGGASTVAWNVVGGYDSVTFGVEGGSASGVGASGSEQVSPTTTTTYELLVTWSGGTIRRLATVTVTQAPVQPTVTFAATPATITAGQSASLTWDVSGTATAISIRALGGGTVATNLASTGSHGVSPEATTTYELVAVWADGEVTAQATVTVEPAGEPEPEPDGPTLTLRLSGEGFGLVVLSPGGEACIDECELTYPEGTTVTISPVALLGSTFDGFSGACEGASCTLTIDRDLVIDARFEFKD